MKKSFTIMQMFLVVAILTCFAIVSRAESFGSISAENASVVNLSAKNLAVSGSVRYVVDKSTHTTLHKTDRINPYGRTFMVINGTGTIVLSATPTISTIAALSGQEIIIMSSSYTVTFSNNGTVAGSLLELGATTRAVGDGDVLKLIFYNGKWREIGFVNNL